MLLCQCCSSAGARCSLLQSGATDSSTERPMSAMSMAAISRLSSVRLRMLFKTRCSSVASASASATRGPIGGRSNGWDMAAGCVLGVSPADATMLMSRIPPDRC